MLLRTFGLLDYLIASKLENYFSSFESLSRNELMNSNFSNLYNPDGEENWICFPGMGRVSDNSFESKILNGMIPPSYKNALVCSLPKFLTGYTPQDTIDAMNSLEKNLFAEVNMRKDFDLDNINIFGFSSGTLPAFYFANKFQAKKLVAVSPGPGLGKGIFTSLGAKYLREKVIESGFDTWESYDKILDSNKINQSQNLAHLPSKFDLIIVSATRDKFILKKEGTNEIVKQLVNNGKNPTDIVYTASGHVDLAVNLFLLNFCHDKFPFLFKKNAYGFS